MRRKVSMLVMAAIVALTMAFAGPAMAAGKSATAPNCEQGISKAQGSKGSAKMNAKAKEALAKNQARCAG